MIGASVLLVFSGLVLEVIDGLPEKRHAEQAALVVFKQQPVRANRQHAAAQAEESLILFTRWRGCGSRPADAVIIRL